MHGTRTLSSAAILILVVVIFSGCATHFTPSGQLQWNLSEAAGDAPTILADFEASEESGVAGDVTKKSGSSCAGGVCTIY